MPKQGAPTCQGKERHLGIPKWPQSHQQSPQHIWSISLTQLAPKNIPELILGHLCPLQPLPPKPARGSEFFLPSPLLQEGEIWESLALSPSPALHLLPSHPWLLAGLFWVPGFIKKKSELLFLCNISKEVRKEEHSDHHAPSWSSQLRFCIPTTGREGALIPSTQKKKHTRR